MASLTYAPTDALGHAFAFPVGRVLARYDVMDDPPPWIRRPQDFPEAQQVLCKMVGRVWKKRPFAWPGIPLVRRVEPVWVAFYDRYGVRSSPNQRVWFVVQSDPNAEAYGRIVDGEPLHFLDALLRASAYDLGVPARKKRRRLTPFVLYDSTPFD